MTGGAKPRLLIVAHEAGAWVNHRLGTADAARDRGWEVELLMGGAGDPVPLATGAIPHYRSLPMARGRGGPAEMLRSIVVIRRAMRAAEVCELVTLKPIALGMLSVRTLRRSNRPRMVATFAGLGTVLDAALQSRRSIVRPFLRFALHGRAAVLVENPDDAAALIAAGIVARKDCHVGPGVGLDESWFAVLPNPLISLVPASAERPLRLLYVGRLIASKGVPELIEAMRLLRRREVPVELTLAGSLDDRNPSAILRATVDGWTEAGLATWLGHVEDPRSVFRHADVVVLMSHREGRPRALMEAQALGIPVVAADVPGVRQAVAPGRSGVLVPPGRPDSLADAIAELARDPARRVLLAEGARTFAREAFQKAAFLAFWESAVLGPAASTES